MKRFFLLFLFLIYLPVLPVQANADIYTQFTTYENSRFGYSLCYPAFLTNVRESDNGDGVTLTDKQNIHKLVVWGQYNLNRQTGQDRLEELLNEIIHIKDTYANDECYYAVWSDDGGKDGNETFFFEYGLVRDDKLAVYCYSYPKDEEDYRILLSGGWMRLDFCEDRNYMDLVLALAASEMKYSDSFDEKAAPAWQTSNNVLYYLVAHRLFSGNFTSERPQSGSGEEILAFSYAVEGETDSSYTPTSPDELYKNYFARGKYTYPDGDYPYIKGTQLGILVKIAAPFLEGLSHHNIVIYSEKEKNGLKFIEIGHPNMLRKIVNQKAVIVLQEAPEAYFGWTILAYKTI